MKITGTAPDALVFQRTCEIEPASEDDLDPIEGSDAEVQSLLEAHRADIAACGEPDDDTDEVDEVPADVAREPQEMHDVKEAREPHEPHEGREAHEPHEPHDPHEVHEPHESHEPYEPHEPHEVGKDGCFVASPPAHVGPGVLAMPLLIHDPRGT